MNDPDNEGYAQVLPRLTLFDSEDSAESKLPSGALLIDPGDAIDLLATGTLTREFPARPWYQFGGDSMESEVYTHSGRVELAEELICDAISSGRLRCIFVISTVLAERRRDALRVEAIDPVQFADHELSIEWGDLGLKVLVDTENAWFEAEGFQFLWNELCELRPGLARLAKEMLQPGQNMPAPEVAARSNRSHSPTRRGRPSGRNGKPIANFTLRVAGNADEFRSIETDDPLGAMLIEEYERLGLAPPNLNNAAKDARGVVDAVLNSIGSAAN